MTDECLPQTNRLRESDQEHRCRPVSHHLITRPRSIQEPHRLTRSPLQDQHEVADQISDLAAANKGARMRAPKLRTSRTGRHGTWVQHYKLSGATTKESNAEPYGNCTSAGSTPQLSVCKCCSRMRVLEKHVSNWYHRSSTLVASVDCGPDPARRPRQQSDRALVSTKLFNLICCSSNLTR